MKLRMYKVLLTKDALKYYKKSDNNTKKKLNKSFEVLQENPYEGSNIKRLHGELAGLYRYRTGALRIIYKIEDEKVSVIIIAIGARGDIYK
mgnify:FL=1